MEPSDYYYALIALVVFLALIAITTFLRFKCWRRGNPDAETNQDWVYSGFPYVGEGYGHHAGDGGPRGDGRGTIDIASSEQLHSNLLT